MKSEDIMRLMFDSCDKHTSNAWHNDFWTITQEELERFAQKIAETERERLAQTFEPMIAEAIRARGQQ